MTDHATLKLSDYELRALAEWHADPERKTDMPRYLRYDDHLRRAVELVDLAALPAMQRGLAMLAELAAEKQP